MLVVSACIQNALIRNEEEYGKSYLTEFVFKDSLEIFAFNVKLAGYFGLPGIVKPTDPV